MADYGFSATLLGAQDLVKRLKNNDSFAKNEIAKALNKAANDAQNKAVELAPKQHGKLKSSIHTEKATPNALVAKVGTNVEYAKYQEYGTGVYGPHNQAYTITPKNKAALFWKGAKHPVKRVTIQGIQPKWFMKQAFEYVLPRKTAYLQEAARRIVQHLAGA